MVHSSLHDALPISEAARERDARFRAGPPEIFHYPTPTLGPGLWRGATPPAGQVFPQPPLAHGQGLDTALGLGFGVIARAALLAQIDAPVRDHWQAAGCALIDDRHPELAAWLDAQGVSAVVLRPDRYVMGVAHDATELRALMEWAPLSDRHAASPLTSS